MLQLKHLLLTALLGSELLTPVFAIPHVEIDARTNDVCKSGVYGSLSFLSNYQPAQQFCASRFKKACTVAKKQKRSMQSSIPSKSTTTSATGTNRRSDIVATASTVGATQKGTTTTVPGNPKGTTTSTRDAKETQIAILSHMAYDALSTFCSCIQTAKVCCFDSSQDEISNIDSHARLLQPRRPNNHPPRLLPHQAGRQAPQARHRLLPPQQISLHQAQLLLSRPSLSARLVQV